MRRSNTTRSLVVFGCIVLVLIAIASGSAAQPARAIGGAAGQVALNVDAAADLRPISPLIYGINFSGFSSAELEALNSDLRVPVQRWGGNLASRYNWQDDMANHGMDWYFESIPEDNPDPATGNAIDHLIENGRHTGTETLVEIPMIGWVAKERTRQDGGYDCSFSTVKYQYDPAPIDDKPPYDTENLESSDCGTGKRVDGTFVENNDKTDANQQVDSTFMQGWVNDLKAKFGPANAGGVRLYNLDNEPGLWAETHRDVAPDYLSYQGLVNITDDYAAQIKAADPGALTLGPAQDGWDRYFFSGRIDQFEAEALQDRVDHGGKPFVAWYLEQLHAYEQQHNIRLLDYFDLHYYPQAPGVTLSPAGNADTQALRLRSTRSLWDPTYPDESWIAGSDDGPYIRLLPRMHEWVDQNYPGTKLAITEYNWGGVEHINGALAQADVLGIFGREGLDLATFFDTFTLNQPVAFAFRMYRNYDGAGAAFGETHVRADSSDQGTLAIYAARRAGDDALTLMVINKTGSAQSTEIGLAGFAAGSSAAVYRYSPANLGAIVREANQVVLPNGFSITLPAESITLFVVPNVNEAPPLRQTFAPLLRR